MVKCSRCGVHVSRIDARIGAELAAGKEAGPVCQTCAVLAHWQPMTDEQKIAQEKEEKSTQNA